PRYDLLNHLLSFQLDRLWRRRVVRRFHHILSRPEAHILDLCCGTGDLTLALKRGGRAKVFGSDFAHPMLVRALQKSTCDAGKRLPKGGSRSAGDRKSTRLNSSHVAISYAVFCWTKTNTHRVRGRVFSW